MFVYWIHLPEQTNVAVEGYVGIAMNFEQRMFAHKSCAKTGKCKEKIGQANSKPLMVNGIVYASWKEASEKTGIPTGSISYLLKAPTAKGKWSAYSLKEVA